MVTPTTALRPSNRVSPVLALKEARRNHHNHWPKAPRWAMALARLHLRSGLQEGCETKLGGRGSPGSFPTPARYGLGPCLSCQRPGVRRPLTSGASPGGRAWPASYACASFGRYEGREGRRGVPASFLSTWAIFPSSPGSGGPHNLLKGLH